MTTMDWNTNTPSDELKQDLPREEAAPAESFGKQEDALAGANSNSDDGKETVRNPNPSTGTIHKRLLPRSLQNHCGEGGYWAVDLYDRRRRKPTDTMVMTAPAPKKKRQKPGPKPRGRPRKLASTANPGAPKRKRGRPRKTEVSSTQDVSSGAVVVDSRATKRKRGRPRKTEAGHSKGAFVEFAESRKDGDTANGQDSCHRHFGPLVHNELAYDAIDVVQRERDSLVPKRKRGRPRKIKVENTNGTFAVSFPSVNYGDSLTDSDSEEDDDSIVRTRKRGRPRKIKVENTNGASVESFHSWYYGDSLTDSDSEEDDDSIVPIRKRGRPRKIKLENINSASVESFHSADDCGDSLTDSDLEEDDDILNLHTIRKLKSRGRPRKVMVKDDNDAAAKNIDSCLYQLMAEIHRCTDFDIDDMNLPTERILSSPKKPERLRTLERSSRCDSSPSADALPPRKLELFLDAMKSATDLLATEEGPECDAAKNNDEGVVILV